MARFDFEVCINDIEVQIEAADEDAANEIGRAVLGAMRAAAKAVGGVIDVDFDIEEYYVEPSRHEPLPDADAPPYAWNSRLNPTGESRSGLPTGSGSAPKTSTKSRACWTLRP